METFNKQVKTHLLGLDFVQFLISVAVGIHTIFFWNVWKLLLFQLPYIFRLASPPANLNDHSF